MKHGRTSRWGAAGLVWLGFCLAFVAPLAAEEPPAPETPRGAAEWIARLGSGAFDDREQAFAALFSLGEEARGAIEAASRAR